MKTIAEFKKENAKSCLGLKQASIKGGRHIEQNQTNLASYGGSDYETWVYEGGTPISGTITDSDGRDHKVL